jgi:hypothetical protein
MMRLENSPFILARGVVGALGPALAVALGGAGHVLHHTNHNKIRLNITMWPSLSGTPAILEDPCEFRKACECLAYLCVRAASVCRGATGALVVAAAAAGPARVHKIGRGGRVAGTTVGGVVEVCTHRQHSSQHTVVRSSTEETQNDA